MGLVAVLALSGAAGRASAESPAWDGGLVCYQLSDCTCGYVCGAGNRCDWQGTGASPDVRGATCARDADCARDANRNTCVEGRCRVTCRTDRDCNPGCYGTVCVAGLCERATSAVDSGVDVPDDGPVVARDTNPFPREDTGIDTGGASPRPDTGAGAVDTGVDAGPAVADAGAEGGMPGELHEGGVRCSAGRATGDGARGWMALGVLALAGALGRRPRTALSRTSAPRSA